MSIPVTPTGLQAFAIKMLATIGVIAMIWGSGFYVGMRYEQSSAAKENAKVQATRAENAQEAGQTAAQVAGQESAANSFFDQLDRAIESTYTVRKPQQTGRATRTTSPLPVSEPTRETIPHAAASSDAFFDDHELRLFNLGNKAAEVERPVDP